MRGPTGGVYSDVLRLLVLRNVGFCVVAESAEFISCYIKTKEERECRNNVSFKL